MRHRVRRGVPRSPVASTPEPSDRTCSRQLHLVTRSEWSERSRPRLATRSFVMEPVGTTAREWSTAASRRARFESDSHCTFHRPADPPAIGRTRPCGRAATDLSGVRGRHGVVAHRLNGRPQRQIVTTVRRGGGRHPQIQAFTAATRRPVHPRARTEREEFVTWVQSVVRDAEIAVHNGDPGPRRAIWSGNDPVTVLGAWKNATGQQELDELFAHLAGSFSNCTSYEFELLEAEVLGDTAYYGGLRAHLRVRQRRAAYLHPARDADLPA